MKTSCFLVYVISLENIYCCLNLAINNGIHLFFLCFKLESVRETLKVIRENQHYFTVNMAFLQKVWV